MGSNDEEKKERTKVGGGRNACVSAELIESTFKNNLQYFIIETGNHEIDPIM